MPVISLIIILYLFIHITNVIYYKFWKRNLTLDIFFSSSEAFEGDKLYLTEILTNRKILPLPWVAVKFQISKYLLFADQNNFKISDDYYKNDLFSIMSYQKVTRKLDFICGKRGIYRIKSAELLSHNLLLTEKLISHVESSTFLTVYPKLLNIDDLRLDSKRITGEILSKRFINPDPFEFRGIREYQAFDDFKSINFKATAKANELMVNMYEYTISKEIIILLNFEHYGSWIDYHLFEKTISLAATLANLYISESIPVKVISGSCDILDKSTVDTGSGSSMSHLYCIYEALARLDLDSEAVPIVDLMPHPVFSANEDKIHILISTYHGNNLTDAFNMLQEGFSNIYWLLPYTMDIKLDGIDKNVITWEVNHDFTTEFSS